MNLIAQAFRLIGSIMCKTSSPEKDSRVWIDGILMMTRVIITESLQRWQDDNDDVLLQRRVDNMKSVCFEVSHMVWSHNLRSYDHGITKKQWLNRPQIRIVPYKPLIILKKYTYQSLNKYQSIYILLSKSILFIIIILIFKKRVFEIMCKTKMDKHLLWEGAYFYKIRYTFKNFLCSSCHSMDKVCSR